MAVEKPSGTASAATTCIGTARTTATTTGNNQILDLTGTSNGQCATSKKSVILVTTRSNLGATSSGKVTKGAYLPSASCGVKTKL
jgi:hypothetical protein